MPKRCGTVALHAVDSSAPVEFLAAFRRENSPPDGHFGRYPGAFALALMQNMSKKLAQQEGARKLSRWGHEDYHLARAEPKWKGNSVRATGRRGRQPPASFDAATPPRTHSLPHRRRTWQKAHLATAAPLDVASAHPPESGRGRSAISGSRVTRACALPPPRGLAIGTGLRAYCGCERTQGQMGGSRGWCPGSSPPGTAGTGTSHAALSTFRCLE